MIITRTPFRISFLGGGTDYPAYFREHGGMVLSTTINKYCYVTTRWLPPFFDHKFRIRYTRREEVNTVNEIQHPSVRECLRHLDIRDGIEMVHTSDIPAMSGIGSSSAFTVGFLHSLYALKGRMPTKRMLAQDAIRVEQEMIGESVGSQDQVAAAFGGLNCITFSGVDGPFVQPLLLNPERRIRLQNSLLLCFTGYSRLASNIACEQIRTTRDRLGELRLMRELADQALSLLGDPEGAIDDFGRLLGESWKIKRSLTTLVTTPEIDQIYNAAIHAGALGGKLCGAGGGGFMLLYAPPEIQSKVREALKNLLFVPFRFEALGSHIAFHAE
jgi:D-glycero-alpha-D-manno-heptose-7-phosphate kinase